MASIGIRELRQRASEFLRRVEAGETIEVTDRGRPVALLTPVPKGSPIETLRASGELAPAIGSRLPDPVEPVPGVPPPSRILEHLRDDEP